MSSLNLEKYDEWKDDKNILYDVMRFLDNVLSDFIKRAPEAIFMMQHMQQRKKEVLDLGVMGFHSYLQKKHSS